MEDSKWQDLEGGQSLKAAFRYLKAHLAMAGTAAHCWGRSGSAPPTNSIHRYWYSFSQAYFDSTGMKDSYEPAH